MDPAAFTYPVEPLSGPTPVPHPGQAPPASPAAPTQLLLPLLTRPLLPIGLFIVQPVVEPLQNEHSSDENMDEEYNAVNDVSNDHIFCTPCDAYTEYFNHENLYLQAVRY